MQITDLITPEAIIPSLRVNSKKQLLQELSERAAIIAGLLPREVFDALLQREDSVRPAPATALPSRMASS